MKADDIVFVDENGNAEANKRYSSEWRFHLSILKDNPSFNCVIHSHSIYSSIVSIMGVDYTLYDSCCGWKNNTFC